MVNNRAQFNMSQLYQLGTTAIGKSFRMTESIFMPDEIILLDKMGNGVEEQQRNLEESFMMNASSISGPKGQ